MLEHIFITTTVTSPGGTVPGRVRLMVRYEERPEWTQIYETDLSGGVVVVPSQWAIAAHAELRVDYLGTETFAPSSSAISTFTYRFASTTTAATSPSTTQLDDTVSISGAVGDNPRNEGYSVLRNAPTPTGQVTIVDTTTGLTLGHATLDGTGAYTLSAALTTGGTHTLTATYSGDSIWAPSTTTTTHVVTKASPTTSVLHAPSTGVYGAPLQVTVGVDPAPHTATPTGQVSLHDGVGGPVVGSCTLTGTSECQVTVTTPLSPGVHHLSATYAGDTSYTAATAVATADVTIGVADTTTTLAISPGAGAVYGQPVSLTVTVAPQLAGSASPAGSVTITDTTTGKTLGTGTLDSSGSYTLTVSDLGVGSHMLAASYDGQGGYRPSSAAPQSLTVTKAAMPTLKLSLTPQDPTPGQQLTLTAVVTPTAPSLLAPVGTVTFTDLATGVILGTVDLVPNNALLGTPAGGGVAGAVPAGGAAAGSLPARASIATLTITAPTSGSHTYQASYRSAAGDSVTTGSTGTTTMTVRTTGAPGGTVQGLADGGQLPYTGTELGMPTAVSVGLMATGLALLLGARRLARRRGLHRRA